MNQVAFGFIQAVLCEKDSAYAKEDFAHPNYLLKDDMYCTLRDGTFRGMSACKKIEG